MWTAQDNGNYSKDYLEFDILSRLVIRFSSGPPAQLKPSTNSEPSWHCVVWQITMLPASNSLYNSVCYESPKKEQVSHMFKI